jgi:glycosyltransferase involved in cell wall biosynthesis
LPVVCTDAGGPAEYVKHDVAGFVVPVGDPAAMAEKVLLLLQNLELRERFARQAREYAETHFRYERMIQQTLAAYRAVA